MLRKNPQERPSDAEIVRLLFMPKKPASSEDRPEEAMLMNGMSKLLKQRAAKSSI
jgi:hypothetical protein